MADFLNCDTFEIKNYTLTKEGYCNLHLAAGVPDVQLVYDGGLRKEIINEDALFNHDSISTAIGKPITLNHPPTALNSRTIGKYQKGTILQQFDQEDTSKALMLAATIHDAEVVKGIMDGKYKYVSAGYKAVKTLNSDGVWVQSNREYDHVAILDENYTPRAGLNSSLHMITNKQNDSTESVETTEKVEPIVETVKPEKEVATTGTIKNEPVQVEAPIEEKVVNPVASETVEPKNTDAEILKLELEKINMDIADRVELLSTWKPILDKHNKAVDYNADSNKIKRDVLGCYYPEKTIKELNDDAVLKGFWLNFVVNNDATLETGETGISAKSLSSNYKMTPVSSNNDSMNYDSAMESERERFRKQLEGAK